MGYKIQLKGFDSLIIGGAIEMPSVAELLRIQFISDASIEDAYRYGDDFTRWMIHNTPLRNDKRYTIVTSQLQYVTPLTCPIPNTEWHCDPGTQAPFLHDASIHIYANNAIESCTDFLEGPVEFEVDDYYLTAGHREFRDHLTSRSSELGLMPKKIAPDTMVTFTNLHAHRATPPSKPELRYFWRVQESDVQVPRPIEQSFSKQTKVLRISDRKQVPSVMQEENWVIIRDRPEIL